MAFIKNASAVFPSPAQGCFFRSVSIRRRCLGALLEACAGVGRGAEMVPPFAAVLAASCLAALLLAALEHNELTLIGNFD